MMQKIIGQNWIMIEIVTAVLIYFKTNKNTQNLFSLDLNLLVSLCRFQMLKKMEQAKKKAEAVVNTVDISEREKMAQLKRYDVAPVGLEPHLKL